MTGMSAARRPRPSCARSDHDPWAYREDAGRVLDRLAAGWMSRGGGRSPAPAGIDLERGRSAWKTSRRSRRASSERTGGLSGEVLSPAASVDRCPPVPFASDRRSISMPREERTWRKRRVRISAPRPASASVIRGGRGADVSSRRVGVSPGKGLVTTGPRRSSSASSDPGRERPSRPGVSRG
jgi:hypothetical protein